jgi:circadian clock protein KaiB
MIQLRIYVVDNSRSSTKAIQDLETLLIDKFSGRYSLEVIDVLAEPELAEVDKILATPTVVKISPEPERRIVGSLGDCEKVLAGLGLANN